MSFPNLDVSGQYISNIFSPVMIFLGDSDTAMLDFSYYSIGFQNWELKKNVSSNLCPTGCMISIDLSSWILFLSYPIDIKPIQWYFDFQSCIFISARIFSFVKNSFYFFFSAAMPCVFINISIFSFIFVNRVMKSSLKSIR